MTTGSTATRSGAAETVNAEPTHPMSSRAAMMFRVNKLVSRGPPGLPGRRKFAD